MPRKLAVIATTGLVICVACLGAAAVIDAPHWHGHGLGAEIFHLGDFESCRSEAQSEPGATANRRELAWDNSDKISIAVPANVHYRPGTGETISITGDPESIAHLRVRHHVIEQDCDGDQDEKVDITLPGRPFRSFTLAGSGTVDLDQLDQPALEMVLAGSGTMKASGKADTVKVTIAGSGDAHLGELAAKTVRLVIAGSGNAEIAPLDEAKIEIAGSGDVRLLTEPKKVDSNIFGSGRIIHAAAH